MLKPRVAGYEYDGQKGHTQDPRGRLHLQARAICLRRQSLPYNVVCKSLRFDFFWQMGDICEKKKESIVRERMIRRLLSHLTGGPHSVHGCAPPLLCATVSCRGVVSSERLSQGLECLRSLLSSDEAAQVLPRQLPRGSCSTAFTPTGGGALERREPISRQRRCQDLPLEWRGGRGSGAAVDMHTLSFWISLHGSLHCT